MKRLIAIWAFAGLAAALCLAAVPIAGLKLTTGADGGGTNSWTNAVDYGTTGGVTLLNAMTTGQLALTRADAANVTGGIAVGFANAASNLAVLVQGTQVTVQGWAVAASNLAVALQGSQAVIRADVATVSNMADAAQTSAEVAEAIAAIHVTGIKYVASSNIVASGAGSNVVDGTYIPASTYGGYPTWTNTTGASVMFYSGGYWFINSEVNGGIWYYYDNGSGSGAPLSGTWLEYTGGVAPAPTMAYAPQTNTLTEAVGLYAPTGTLGTAAYQASSAFDAAGSALAATNGLAAPLMAFTPTSRWVSSASGIATGLTVRGGTVTARLTSTLDQGFMAAITNGYGVITTNTDATGYAFMAAQNNSEDVLSFGVRGTAAAGTLFGVTNAGSAQVYSYAAPLLLGAYGDQLVVLGANDKPVLRFDDGGITGLVSMVLLSNLTVNGTISGSGLAYIGSSNGIGTNTTVSGWLTAGAVTGSSAAVSGRLESIGTNYFGTTIVTGMTHVGQMKFDGYTIGIGETGSAGPYGNAIGYGAYAGEESVTLGLQAMCRLYSVAVGNIAGNEGYYSDPGYSVQIGYGSDAYGNAVALGAKAVAQTNSIAIGFTATNATPGTAFIAGHLIQTGAVSAASLNASGAITGASAVVTGNATVASNLTVTLSITGNNAKVTTTLDTASLNASGSITGLTYYGNGVGLTNCTPVIRPTFIAAILQTNGYAPAVTSQIICARLVHQVGTSGYSTNTGNWTPPAGELEMGASFRCRDVIAANKYVMMYLFKNGAPWVDLWEYHTAENENPLMNPIYYWYNDSATNVYSIQLWPETTNTFFGDQNSRWWGRVIKAD